MRVGIFLPNWIGDVVMATPTVRALRRQIGASGKLIGIMRPYVADVLSGSSWLDEVICYDKQPGRFSLAGREDYENLRAARLDRVVLLTNSLRTAWMAWRSAARERIGYAGEGRRWLLSTPVSRPRTRGRFPLPTIDGYLRLAAVAGCATDDRRLELSTTDSDEHAANNVWQELGLPDSDRVIMFNSGGAYGAAKLWPPEYFAELARRLVVRGKYWVLVNCGPAERQIAREIVTRAASPQVVSLAHVDELPIGLTKACIRRSRLVVTTDSGPRFIAIAFSKPVVSLFGPTNPAATATHYERESCVRLKLDCQPCMERTCPLHHHRCMRELSVERVYAAVVDMLKGGTNSQAA
jgi:heptosyltransferase-2